MEVVFILDLPDHALIPDIIQQENIPTASPGIGSSGGGICSNRYGVTENVGYMNDVAISYGLVSGHEKTI